MAIIIVANEKAFIVFFIIKFVLFFRYKYNGITIPDIKTSNNEITMLCKQGW
ncbi:MAG: hypothetical protein ABIH48_02795 [Candidatus Falkowbacteria bacterium]